MPDTPSPAASVSAQETRPPWKRPQKSWLLRIVIVVLALVAVCAVLAAWRFFPFSNGSEQTDNAYVRGRTTVIAPQVSGYVVAVPVHDYEDIAAGAVLARIDDRVYVARVEQARANLDKAIADLKNSDQAHASRKAAIDARIAEGANARAQLARARADMARADDLSRDGSVSVRERDQTLAGLRQNEAGMRQAAAAEEIARQDLRTVDVGRTGLQAQVEAARAQLHSAEIDLEHTVVRAPEAGRLGEVGVRLGVFVTAGTQLMALVPNERWVIANFKEAQTGAMKVGQPASFTVDALNGQRFQGRVERLSPATGAEFAVLKPDNATGNFVKIPQRLGVRIALDADQADVARLAPGMSVVVAIDTTAR